MASKFHPTIHKVHSKLLAFAVLIPALLCGSIKCPGPSIECVASDFFCEPAAIFLYFRDQTTSTPRFLFVTNSAPSQVAIFSVDAATGVIALSDTLTTATTAEDILIHPNGNFAYILNSTGNSINEYNLDVNNGNLTAIGSQVVLTGVGNPAEFGIDASGNFIYVSHDASNQVEHVTVNSSSGRIAPGPLSATGALPRRVAISPNNLFAYAPTTNDGTLNQFAIAGATGILTPLTPATVTVPFTGANIVIRADGSFAYLAVRSSSFVQALTVDATTGQLALLGTTPTGISPEAICITPDGKFVYTANDNTNNLSMFVSDATTGTLSSAGAELATGTGPRNCAMDPRGLFLFVTNAGGTPSLYSYRIDQTTGLLTQISAVATGLASVTGMRLASFLVENP